MSVFFARFWVVQKEIVLCHTSTGPITHNLAEIDGASVFQCKIEGEFLKAEELLKRTTFKNRKLSIDGVKIAKQGVIDA